ncbi:MAG: sugar transferase [Pseudomonadota bacterium]
MPAPIVLFAFNRPGHLSQVLAALRADPLAEQSDITIFCDGPRGAKDVAQVQAVLDVARAADGFRSIDIRERIENAGLRTSITEGVSEIVEDRGRAIVLEDDIVVSPAFLTYLNRALDHYREVPKVWHVSGWNYPIAQDIGSDSFLWRGMNCWGWGTWADRWKHFRLDPAHILDTWTFRMVDRFTLDGAWPDFWNQIQRNANGEIRTWAIFWAATILENNGLCLNPRASLVNNIGMDGSGTNFKDGMSVPEQAISAITEIAFPSRVAEDRNALRHIKTHLLSQQRKPFKRRLKYRVRMALERGLL